MKSCSASAFVLKCFQALCAFDHFVCFCRFITDLFGEGHDWREAKKDLNTKLNIVKIPKLSLIVIVEINTHEFTSLSPIGISSRSAILIKKTDDRIHS